MGVSILGDSEPSASPKIDNTTLLKLGSLVLPMAGAVLGMAYAHATPLGPIRHGKLSRAVVDGS